MKKLVVLFSALWIVGSASLAFADSYRGSRYNPYDPFRNEPGRDQGPVGGRGVYETDKGIPSYGTEPRRWYDSQENYQEAYGRNVKDPRTLTHPYRDTRPYSSEELTSPYEGVIPQRPGKTTPTQQLTPPVEK